MNPKLLLALALVGAVHAGEPSTPDRTYAAPTSLATSAGVISALAFTRDVTFTGPGADESSWLVVHCDPNCHGYEDAYAPAKVKLTVTREPTVTKKPDGSWEITFGGKTALSALTVPNTPEIQAQVLAPYAAPVLSPPIGEHAKELEAASNILPPAPPTVLWPNEVWQAESDKRTLDNPHSLNWAQKFTVEVSGKRYEFGLRSDGCVVWRERK